MNVSLDTPVLLFDEQDQPPHAAMSLRVFFAINDFADEEKAAIIHDLDVTGEHIGGGGAAATFIVVAAPI